MGRAYEKDRLDIFVNRKVSLVFHTNVKQERVFAKGGGNMVTKSDMLELLYLNTNTLNASSRYVIRNTRRLCMQMTR